MKLYLALMLAAAAAFGAEEPKAPPPKPAKAAAKPKPAPEVKVPEGAVETEPGTWKYTDSKGVKWIYRATPFGIAKTQAKAMEDAKKGALTPEKEAERITAYVDGDTVRFEKPGPFGVYKWEKKVSDLDETEKAALERSKTAASKQE